MLTPLLNLEKPPNVILFNAEEILNQIHRELIKHGINFNVISLERWKQYILARAIEDVLMLDIAPGFDIMMEQMSSVIRSNYRRQVGEEIYTLHYDVGTNKLLQLVGSDDLPFESQLDIHRHGVRIGPRTSS